MVECSYMYLAGDLGLPNASNLIGQATYIRLGKFLGASDQDLPYEHSPSAVWMSAVYYVSGLCLLCLAAAPSGAAKSGQMTSTDLCFKQAALPVEYPSLHKKSTQSVAYVDYLGCSPNCPFPVQHAFLLLDWFQKLFLLLFIHHAAAV